MNLENYDLLIDFADPSTVALWNPINDGVMGGVSSSQMRHDPAGHAVFTGRVSFENNGGFASVRCRQKISAGRMSLPISWRCVATARATS